MNADLVLELLIAAVTHANDLAALYAKAQAEGRDVTDAELDIASQGTQAALDRLKAAKKS